MFHIPDPKIIRSFRNSITFHITPSQEFIIKAPFLMPLSKIEQLIEEKQEWIKKKLAKINIIAEKQFVSGETFFYLGKVYVLEIGDFQKITLAETLQFPRMLLFRARKELTDWYIQQAREKITQRVTHHAAKMGAKYKHIFFSDTRSKWGTCTHDNILQFSWRLIMAPLFVLDYVVIHELVHTKEKNHGENFWRQVKLHTPAYKQHRKWLQTNAQVLHF